LEDPFQLRLRESSMFDKRFDPSSEPDSDDVSFLGVSIYLPEPQLSMAFRSVLTDRDEKATDDTGWNREGWRIWERMELAEK
jgi:hypothetical protein